MLTTERLSINEATPNEIGAIMAIENDKNNGYFIWSGTQEEHLSEIKDPNILLLTIYRKSDNLLIGFIILDYHNDSHSYEIRRLAITDKHLGYGKEALDEIFRYIFLEKKVNKIWLEVHLDNVYAIKLFERMHMQKDGILRAHCRVEHSYLDLLIYSILRDEYYKQDKDL